MRKMHASGWPMLPCCRLQVRKGELVTLPLPDASHPPCQLLINVVLVLKVRSSRPNESCACGRACCMQQQRCGMACLPVAALMHLALSLCCFAYLSSPLLPVGTRHCLLSMHPDLGVL